MTTLRTVEGVYRKGKIELGDVPQGVTEDTKVIVTFLSKSINLADFSFDEEQAAELRSKLTTFEDWNSPDMDVYNDYDAAKSQL